MTIDTRREYVFPSPPDVVRRAIPAAAARERWDDVTPRSDGWELRRLHRRMVVHVVEADAGRTRVAVEYHVERGYYTGLWDVFDFYGREAEKLLHDLWQVLGEQANATHPPPASILPPTFAPGQRVVALARDGQPHAGRIEQCDGGRCLIAFDDVGSEWVGAHDVHTDARAASS